MSALAVYPRLAILDSGRTPVYYPGFPILRQHRRSSPTSAVLKPLLDAQVTRVPVGARVTALEEILSRLI